ncbi:MAG: 16S rRNA (cytosine(1402)-N(4))-methyltransferase RsmH [Pseudomonadota bacterium]|jgi:16S rRNA (cytosine1402-N4)-methyltransferase|nr:16S rRNA (cytosine(1402)-N(4))-methyltransferase RsmH [Pseudomonadota bacterium]
MSKGTLHQTVLQAEAIEALAIKKDGNYIDATFGRGGHSKAILSLLSEKGCLIAIDRDPEAITHANKFKDQDSKLKVVQATFGEIGKLEETEELRGKIDGILFDLGVSSPQLDNPDRGFSFMHNGPLDMRMNQMDQLSAAQWINTATEKEIADVLFRFGEERHSRRMAKRVVAARQEKDIETTGQLAELVKAANPAWEKGKHPATRAFQAIRIHINNELEQIEDALNGAVELLRGEGRLVVISFHSLEDRIVKNFLTNKARGDNFPRDLPVTAEQLNPTLKKIGKAIRAKETEVLNNPRARSAVMRVAEKPN